MTAEQATGPQISTEHPGIADLFAVLAYGEVSAFYRLAEEAQQAPSLRGRVAVAKMAASELSHFTMLEKAIAERGGDALSAMEPFVAAIDDYHAATNPSTWGESLVKFYVADGLAADFYAEIASALPKKVAAIVREVLESTASSEFVIEEVRALVENDTAERDRLVLWGRRLLGEAVTQAQMIMAQRMELTELLISATGDLNNIVRLFDRMESAHSERMVTLGLG
ncbi:ferritin-like fold-containing protein [Smaragdicoccus niigatensis]|uniref:ferritin-like fold-containing protein n=1 Tax=Smaragdicoccus niigatensis TaxID=359359 RepID=UPI00036D3A57|nr:ferritin-like fold-containing protein [Smaragdicoccus niigatensis]